MASRAHSRGRNVTFLQFLGLLMALVLLASAGGVLAAGFFMPVAVAANSTTDGVTQIFDDLPDNLQQTALSQQSRIYASDGKTLLATFYAENRIVKPLSQISPAMQQAVIDTEDKRFYEHGGIDFTGFTRAAVNNVMGNAKQGGSTLAQQYVKNVQVEQAVRDDDPIAQLNAKKDTLGRKAREAKLAISLEKKMSKDDILQGYLNIAQFGKGIYGVEAAAQRYFNTSAAKLNYLQAATIAGITKAPSQYDPSDPKNLKDSTDRRDTVLHNMYEQGHITKEEYDKGIATPLQSTLHLTNVQVGCQAAGSAAFFCDYVTREIMTNPVFGKTKADRQALLYRGGLNIVTTLDVNKQAAAQNAVNAISPTDSSGLATALTSITPGTGEIVAMAQNRPYSTDENPPPGKTSVNYNADWVHGGSSGFQAGSTFKMFDLAEWLKEGHSLNDVVNADEHTWSLSRDFTAPCTTLGGTWNPGNSEAHEAGNMTVQKATEDSVNRAYVAMASKMNLCSLANTAQEIGYRPASPNEKTIEVQPAMILGTQTTSPLAMTNAYATIAAGGIYCDPIAIKKITDSTGKNLAIPQANCHRTLDESIANTISAALQPVLTRGSAKVIGSIGRPAAGKTGTTNLGSQTWFIGYTPNLAAGVWVGDPSGNKNHLSVRVGGKYLGTLYGATLAAPEWKTYMETAVQGMPVEQFGAANAGMVNTPQPKQTASSGQNGSGTSRSQNGTTSSGGVSDQPNSGGSNGTPNQNTGNNTGGDSGNANNGKAGGKDNKANNGGQG